MRWRSQFQFDTRCSKRATRLADQTSWRFDPDRLCGLHDFVHSCNSCVKLSFWNDFFFFSFRSPEANSIRSQGKLKSEQCKDDANSSTFQADKAFLNKKYQSSQLWPPNVTHWSKSLNFVWWKWCRIETPLKIIEALKYLEVIVRQYSKHLMPPRKLSIHWSTLLKCLAMFCLAGLRTSFCKLETAWKAERESLVSVRIIFPFDKVLEVSPLSFFKAGFKK